MKIKNVSVNIKKPVYSMATTDGQTAEIVMYGDIYESQPVDWWTGEPIEGQFILLSEFLDDLKQISNCKIITIRMNSYGGDAVVAITIHNRLRDLVKGGATLTCIVDGVAMSGGSLIMCACDTVRVNPSSLIMIHKCWTTLWGGYNADELREIATSNDAYDKAQVSIYKRKTGLSDTVLSHMMGDTTYMTGSEAVDKGFADELIEDAEPLNIAASADGRTLVFKGRQVRLAPGMFAPDSIPTVTPEASATVETNKLPDETGEGGSQTMAKNLEELRKENPELAAALEAEARAAVQNSGDPVPAPVPDASGNTDPVRAERQRIQDIDAVAHLFDDETVQQAKYGDHPCTAQEMAYRAAQKAAQQGRSFLSGMEADTKASGAQNVVVTGGGNNPDTSKDSPEAMIAQAQADAKAFNDRKKEVR